MQDQIVSELAGKGKRTEVGEENLSALEEVDVLLTSLLGNVIQNQEGNWDINIWASTSEVENPVKLRKSESVVKLMKNSKEMANLVNEVHERIIDILKFLGCVSELNSRVPEYQKGIFRSCVENRLAVNPYYPYHATQCIVKDLDEKKGMHAQPIVR